MLSAHAVSIPLRVCRSLKRVSTILEFHTYSEFAVWTKPRNPRRARLTLHKTLAGRRGGQWCLWAEDHIVRIPGLRSLCAGRSAHWWRVKTPIWARRCATSLWAPGNGTVVRGQGSTGHRNAHCGLQIIVGAVHHNLKTNHCSFFFYYILLDLQWFDQFRSWIWHYLYNVIGLMCTHSCWSTNCFYIHVNMNSVKCFKHCFQSREGGSSHNYDSWVTGIITHIVSYLCQYPVEHFLIHQCFSFNIQCVRFGSI